MTSDAIPFTTAHATAEDRRAHARGLMNYEPTGEAWRIEECNKREVCDGFRVPDQSVLVARGESDMAGIGFLTEGGSSMTTNFWFGEPKACEQFVATLIASSQRMLPTAGFNPEDSDCVLICVWDTPGTGKWLVGTLAVGDWAAAEDDVVLKAADTLGMVGAAFGGNDNGPHNLFDEDLLEDAEEDEVADYIETARLNCGPSAWKELKEILADEHEDAFKLWKKQFAKKKSQPQ